MLNSSTLKVVAIVLVTIAIASRVPVLRPIVFNTAS